MKRDKNRILDTNKLHIENKTLFIDLKENESGRFLQIAELSNARRSMVIIPERGIDTFLETVRRMVKSNLGRDQREERVYDL